MKSCLLCAATVNNALTNSFFCGCGFNVSLQSLDIDLLISFSDDGQHDKVRKTDRCSSVLKKRKLTFGKKAEQKECGIIEGRLTVTRR